jgi:hypothetical protein
MLELTLSPGAGGFLPTKHGHFVEDLLFHIGRCTVGIRTLDDNDFASAFDLMLAHGKYGGAEARAKGMSLIGVR